eukprot:COSAG06_NODE_33522_length_488_cov_1.061697_2_plen_133_part_01
MTDVQQGCVINAMMTPEQGDGYGSMTDGDVSTWHKSTVTYTSRGHADADGLFHTAFKLDGSDPAEPLCGLRWYGVRHQIGDAHNAKTTDPDIAIQFTQSPSLAATPHGDLAGMDAADWQDVTNLEKELGVDPD